MLVRPADDARLGAGQVAHRGPHFRGQFVAAEELGEPAAIVAVLEERLEQDAAQGGAFGAARSKGHPWPPWREKMTEDSRKRERLKRAVLVPAHGR